MSKQIVYCGWDSPPAVQLPGIPSYSQQQPACRGVDSFVTQAVRGTNHRQLLNLASPEPWIKEDFDGYMPGKGLLWCRLLGGVKPIQHWDRVCEHVRLVSGIAGNLGCAGILLDIESYKNTVPIFQCPAGTNFWLADYATFKSGQEFSKAMLGTILAFHRLLSHLIDLVPPVGGGDRQVPLNKHLYGLLPAFIAGLLSNSDGPELIDYCGTNLPREPDEVYEQFVAVRSSLPEICEIDYRQVRLGQSMYLDQFMGNKLDFYGMLQAHYRCSEVGVLLYGEAGRLCLPNPTIHAPPTPYPYWPHAIPNFSDSLDRVADPVSFARDATHPSILGDWRFGKRPGSEIAQLTTDKNTLVGSGGGWLFQQIAVKPGQSFAFSCKTSGVSNVWMGGRWHDHRPVWIEDRRASRKFYPDEQGRCSGTIVAPPGAETLLVTMAAEHQAVSDKTTFTEPKVCRI